MTMSDRGAIPTLTIEQTILIRATRARIFAVLTERPEIEAWWGAVSDDPDEKDRLWPGVREGDPRLIVQESIPDELLVLRWDHPHSDDPSRVFPNEVQFSLTSAGEHVLVTVEHGGFPDEPAWAGAFVRLHHGWPEELGFLQAWVESNRRRNDLKNPDKFVTVAKTLTLDADVDWAWRALTEPTVMGLWLDATVRCTPELGGGIDIRWPDGSHVGGEIALIERPHHLITHWWDADSLAKDDDPGLITVMRWTLKPLTQEQTQLELVDTGYDLTRVDDEWMAEITKGWDEMLGNLVALSHHTD